MYLYLAHNPVAGFDDNDYRNWKVLGVMAPTRGRVAKNHTKVEACGMDIFVATIKNEDVVDELVRTPEKLKQAVVSGSQKLAERNPGEMAILHNLIGAVHTALTELPEEYYSKLPKSMAATLTGIKGTLHTTLSNLEAVQHPSYYKEGATALTANKRLLNSVISALPSGAGWSCLDVSGPRPEVEESAAAEETAEETPDKMVAGGDYGFNKISADEGTDTNETSVTGVFVPKPDETYIINEQVAHLFKILQISRQNSPQNVRLIGPHGCGKTELAIQFAGRLGLPLLIMDCANLREARDWFGYKTAKDGTVYWHESQFVRAVEAGNHIILLDELNRANPHLLNTLMPLLDARRFTYLEEKGDKISVGPGTVFFASMNEGAGYTGTSALDRAIRDRFPRIIEMTYLGEDDEINLLVRRVGVSEEIATRLVQMANKIRQDATGLSATLTESMSTRQLLAAAHDFAIGGVDTLTFTISNHFSPDGDDDSERVRVQNIIQGKFGDLIAARAAQAVKNGA
jgi:Holliday junction resolvasome RuvABC ATP-dependent DNA helicase subunit